MTEIDAINRMLRYIGELPIPSNVTIDSLPEGHEAVQARTILAETLREEQENKFWFNTFTIKFVPDTENRITLPNNVVAFENIDYFKEGGDLYTKETMSSVFISQCPIFHINSAARAIKKLNPIICIVTI